MSIAEFNKFLSRQQKPEPIDPDFYPRQLREWRDYLQKLYDRVQGYLKSYIDAGSISLSYEDIELSEENLGSYTVKEANIQLGLNFIKLSPIGTLLIGTKGRVDIKGPRGIQRLILADRDSSNIKITVQIVDPNNPPPSTVPKIPNWEWKLVSSPPSTRPTFETLTQENFLNALMAVSNG